MIAAESGADRGLFAAGTVKFHRWLPIGLAFWVMVAGIGVFAGCGGTEIQHGLDERQANLIVFKLRKAGIEATKVKEKGRKPAFTITVPVKQASKAFDVLLIENLPRPKDKGVGEVFGGSGLVPTSTEEHIKMVYAMSGELSKTLKRMDGVLDARVHLVVPRRSPLADPEAPKPQPKASVYLKVEAGKTPASLAAIQSLVAGSVAGLDSKNVSVLVQQGTAASKIEATPVESSGQTLKVVAIAALVGLLILGFLVTILAIRLRNLKRQVTESAGMEGQTSSGTGTFQEPM